LLTGLKKNKAASFGAVAIAISLKLKHPSFLKSY
jgi:hypothetical protein